MHVPCIIGECRVQRGWPVASIERLMYCIRTGINSSYKIGKNRTPDKALAKSYKHSHWVAGYLNYHLCLPTFQATYIHKILKIL